MTATAILADGRQMALPVLLQWAVRRTDGDPCGSFRLRTLMQAKMAAWLDAAAEIVMEEGGRTVFTGVIDDCETEVTARGVFLDVTGRSMAARLLDNQVRAQEFISAQPEDILNTYVRPYGIKKVDAEQMPAVAQFVVETGYTCWQVLAGFCRHSADIFPRFSADGTLVLRKSTGGKLHEVEAGQILSLRDNRSRFAVSSMQVLVNTKTGQQQTATNEAFMKNGGRRVLVGAQIGTKTRATFRTAQQRLDDAARSAREVEVELAGGLSAEPCDRVRLNVPQIGVNETFWVRAVEHSADETGRKCTLELMKKL